MYVCLQVYRAASGPSSNTRVRRQKDRWTEYSSAGLPFHHYLLFSDNKDNICLNTVQNSGIFFSIFFAEVGDRKICLELFQWNIAFSFFLPLSFLSSSSFFSLFSSVSFSSSSSSLSSLPSFSHFLSLSVSSTSSNSITLAISSPV